jgi:hypothetical protein
MFPETSAGRTVSIPDLEYMTALDDTWLIGSGICGVQVRQIPFFPFFGFQK